jgi:hypothetical protein
MAAETDWSPRPANASVGKAAVSEGATETVGVPEGATETVWVADGAAEGVPREALGADVGEHPARATSSANADARPRIVMSGSFRRSRVEIA